MPNAREHAAVTTVADAIVDPYGSGPSSFVDLQAVRGSFFVYGSAGPPKGHAVYDPKNRIALYDVGCCSWPEVVAHADVAKPPKRITERTLTGIHSMRGIRLGDTMEKIRATFGPSAARPVANAGFEQTISYRRPLAAPHESCDATMTFLFVRNRLTAMDYGNWC